MSDDEPCPQCGSQVWDLVLTPCCGIWMCEVCKDVHDEKWHIAEQARSGPPWCCEKGEAANVKVCPECAEASAAYQAASGAQEVDRG